MGFIIKGLNRMKGSSLDKLARKYNPAKKILDMLEEGGNADVKSGKYPIREETV